MAERAYVREVASREGILDGQEQTFGGFGYAQEYDIERKWRELRIFRTAPISTNMVLANVAQHVLGLLRTY